MLRYAARYYGVRGVGLTLSGEQASWARARIQEDGLDGRLEIRLQDYREVTGKFDGIVSVGMFEHVGVGFYGTFFRTCSELLGSRWCRKRLEGCLTAFARAAFTSQPSCKVTLLLFSAWTTVPRLIPIFGS